LTPNQDSHCILQPIAMRLVNNQLHRIRRFQFRLGTKVVVCIAMAERVDGFG